MPTPVEDATVAALRTALTRASRRAAIVASNLANVDTPGFEALDLRFTDALEEASSIEPARTDSGHLAPLASPRSNGILETAPATRVRNDGNTVDIDHEMSLLALLQGRYQGAAEMVRKRFALLIYAGTDGRTGG
jgi:flagellar basal-body rod protein FlgB